MKLTEEQIAINRLMCGNTAHSCKADYINTAIQALEEIQQYRAIGTVEEFEAIKQWKSDVMEGFCKYDASSFEEIVVNARAKAIDEFADRLYSKITAEIDDCADELDWIDEIAEQMKAGDNSE